MALIKKTLLNLQAHHGYSLRDKFIGVCGWGGGALIMQNDFHIQSHDQLSEQKRKRMIK